ncbi:hypothetical protein SAMN04489752_0319 [Brevibacterium siliguriense]|uniref:HutD protein n=1 Tax=Brevibacterium siliguriense TaxID=1136497 RepID=A0A1H1M299_9MICO|nr:hypothetical protein [Brevibacterium siliguriense]SDR80797.1 hypothetical protein SAMN04489752_0319 [Brevibacterium siliguriense]
MVILRSGAIAKEVEPSGRVKIAAAPDSGRANEPWQWRLTIGDSPSSESNLNGQNLTISNPGSEGEKILELMCEKNLVTGAMRLETLSSQRDFERADGDLIVIYMHTGELAFDQHRLGPGDAAIISGSEHRTVRAEPVADQVDFVLVRLGSATETGLVWIP